MKLKKQIIVPIVAVSALSAAVVPVVMATVNKPKQPEVKTDLFNIENGVLKGFKAGVTQAQIDEYTKDGVLRLPECKVIGSQAFRGVDVPFAKEIQIDCTIKEIGQFAFYGCDQVEKVSFVGTQPSILSAIGNSAFAHCSALTGFPFPKTFKSIGDYAFMGCNSLRELDFTAFVSGDGKLDDDNKKAINNITIGKSAFLGLFPEATIDKPIELKVAPFDVESLGCDVTNYGARFVLSQFASRLQLKIDARASEQSNWIAATSDGTPFEVRTVIPSEFLLVNDNVLTGTTTEAKQILKFVKYSAIQVPAGVTSIDVGFWKDEGIASTKNAIADLDLYESNMVNIPANFLYTNTGEVAEQVLPNLENVRLNRETTSIGSYAFCGMTESMKSKFKWINLNSLENLQMIGDCAFAGNKELCSFANDPCIRGQETKETLEIDLSLNNLTINPHAFEATGIYNIVLKNVNSEKASQTTFAVDSGGEGWYFGELENLRSISFKNFLYNASYSEPSDQPTITIVDNDNASTALTSLFVNENGNPKYPFGGCFNNVDIGDSFIEVPGWSSPEAETAYPDIAYFDGNKPANVTVVGGLSASVKDYFELEVDDITKGIFESWARHPQETEVLSFEETHDGNILKVTPQGTPTIGNDFNFTIDFNTTNAPMSIDRNATSVKIGEVGSQVEFDEWILTTDPNGQQAFITIPAEAVTGDISVDLHSQARRQIAGTAVTYETVLPFTQALTKTDPIYEGEEWSIVLNTDVADEADLNTKKSNITIEEATLSYGSGWTYTHRPNTNSWNITVYGWSNVWKSAAPTISAKFTPAANPYPLKTEFTAEAFKTQPDVTVTQINVGDTISINIGNPELNTGYVWTEMYLDMQNSKAESWKRIPLEYNESTHIVSSKETVPYNKEIVNTVLVLQTGKTHAVDYTIEEASESIITWSDKNPTFIIEGRQENFRVQLVKDRELDLTKSKISIPKNGDFTLQELYDAHEIDIKPDPQAEYDYYDIVFTESGVQHLFLFDITFYLAAIAE